MIHSSRQVISLYMERSFRVPEWLERRFREGHIVVDETNSSQSLNYINLEIKLGFVDIDRNGAWWFMTPGDIAPRLLTRNLNQILAAYNNSGLFVHRRVDVCPRCKRVSVGLRFIQRQYIYVCRSRRCAYVWQASRRVLEKCGLASA